MTSPATAASADPSPVLACELILIRNPSPSRRITTDYTALGKV